MSQHKTQAVQRIYTGNQQHNRFRYHTQNDSFNTERQRLKTKYQLYMHQRQKERQLISQIKIKWNNQYEKGQEQNSIQQLKIPKIRTILKDRQTIKCTLRQTINKYSYFKNQNQKKIKQFNRKKNKYDRIMKIRQSYHIEKMQMNLTKETQCQEQLHAKKNVRRLVLSEQSKLSQSRTKLINEKKKSALQSREQKRLDRQKIRDEQNESMNRKKMIRSQIILEDRQSKERRVLMEERQRRFSTEQQYKKLQKQLQLNMKINSVKKRTASRVSRKIEELQKSKQIFTRKIDQHQLMRQKQKDRNEKLRGGFNKLNNALFSTTTGMALSQDI